MCHITREKSATNCPSTKTVEILNWSLVGV